MKRNIVNGIVPMYITVNAANITMSNSGPCCIGGFVSFLHTHTPSPHTTLLGSFHLNLTPQPHHLDNAKAQRTCL